ncbi:MAG: hypothetical protein R6V73_05050 [Anaerolineales bacterium]|jgi:hypothetical protein
MNTSFVLILAVVCFFIGIIVAYLIQSLRDEKKPAEQETPPIVEQEPVSDAPPAIPSSMIEVARIWKDKSSLQPVLEMEGDIYRKAEDIHPAQLEKFNATITELCGWLGQPAPTHPPTDEAPAFLTGELPLPTTAVKPVRRRPLDILKNSLEADVRSTIKSAPKSLAAQVDEILQEKLADSNMAGRGIRIMDTPSADLVVMVGLSKYDGIEAVPDPEIQAIIREAVAEWGKRALE